MYDSAPIPWLLAATTPSICTLTLRRLLDRPEEDANVSSVAECEATEARSEQMMSETQQAR